MMFDHKHEYGMLLVLGNDLPTVIVSGKTVEQSVISTELEFKAVKWLGVWAPGSVYLGSCPDFVNCKLCILGQSYLSFTILSVLIYA